MATNNFYPAMNIHGAMPAFQETDELFRRRKAAEIAEQSAQRQNKLADLEIGRNERVNALMGNPGASASDFARAGRSDISNAMLGQQQFEQAQEAQKLQSLNHITQLAKRLSLIKDPAERVQASRAVLSSPVIQQQFKNAGVDIAQMANADDAAFDRGIQVWATLDPNVQMRTIGDFNKPLGGIWQQNPITGEVKEITGPDTTQNKPTSRFRPMTPVEIKAAGLPEGSSAQIDDSTGKIDVLGKPDKPALSQKQRHDARLKLNNIEIARQQLANVKLRFLGGKDRKGRQLPGIRGSMSAGAFGQGMVPSEAGNAFDAAVDQLRGTITALTRTPGIGSMSDFETRLDQAKMPNRRNYEKTTLEQIEGLELMLNQLTTGYSELLSGSGAPNSPNSPTSPGDRPITATGPNGQKLILRNGQWVAQ